MTIPTYEPKSMDAYPLPTSDGAYWAWSLTARSWILVEVSRQSGEIHGIQDALDRLRYQFQLSAWVGPCAKPDGPPGTKPTSPEP